LLRECRLTKEKFDEAEAPEFLPGETELLAEPD